MKNMLVAQSGGPTAAINATMAGVIEKALLSHKIDNIYGAVNGIKGVLNDKIINLREIFSNSEKLDLLCNTPASALGSCRYKLKDFSDDISEYSRIFEVLNKYNIGYFVYIGGNDSMDTVFKLEKFCREKGIEDIKIIGAPKTIDNDLCETDHCPGFGSAAKYIASTFSEIICDCNVYSIDSVTIVEVMGRNAGWLTASSCLSRLNNEHGPNLIYLCEKAFDVDIFLDDVEKEISKHKNVIVAVSEGLKNSSGNYISEDNQSGAVDVFGHKYLSGVGKHLENIVRQNIGCKARSIELNLMQRCASHIASKTDISESKMLGFYAAESAIEGYSGKMAAIKRLSDSPYRISFELVDISKIANREKKVPLDWINKSGNDITKDMIKYLYPLIQGEINTVYKNGIPQHIKIV